MKGWATKTIGDVCAIVNGGTPKTNVPEYWDGAHLWITPAEMGKRASPYADDTARKLTNKGLEDCSAKMLPPHSVILSSRAPIGHLVINTAPMATNQGCKGLIPGKSLDHKFLFYYLGSIVDHLNDLGTGATFKELSGGKLKEVEIPLPPLNEQRRIVAVLDEAFARLATMRANAEANLANARALFDSHLNTIFSQKGEGWMETTIEKEADIKVGFAFKSEKYIKSGNGVRLLRGDNIIQGELRWDDCKLWPTDDVAEYEDYQLLEGDIVLAMDRTWVKAGIKFAQLSAEDLPALLVQRVARLRTNDDASQRYLFHVLGSSIFTKYVLDIQTGLGVPHISGKQIAAFKYQKPSKAKKAEIVEAIDALSLENTRLESLYRQKLAAIDELKQSLLQKAFAGELISDHLAA